MRFNIFNQTVKSLTIQFAVILMSISLVSSVLIYKIAERQIDSGFRRQQNELTRREIGFGPLTGELRAINLAQYREAKARLINGLVIFNLVTLAGGTYLSYNLAKRTLRPIKDAMQAQNNFTADASHELRTPLTAMKTELEVATRDKKMSTKELREVLVSTLEEVDKLHNLSENLLLLAQLPHQRETNNFTKVDLKSVLQKAIATLEPTARAKKVAIHSKLNSINKINIVGSQSGLERAAIIIIDNAVKYSPDNGEVRVSAKSSDEAIEILINDQGPGISRGDQKKIFNRFYRTDQARSSQSGTGYGLGLPIAKALVEEHGGSISVDSQVGKGSTFTILLPTQKVQAG